MRRRRVAIGHRFQSLREHLRPDEIANLLAPDNRLFAWLSLYRLPVTWQAVLRVLLLVPLGSLVVALFRNLVGIKTYGTFMPVLIALALRGFPLHLGLGLVAAVITLAIWRARARRLRLLRCRPLDMLCFVGSRSRCRADRQTPPASLSRVRCSRWILPADLARYIPPRRGRRGGCCARVLSLSSQRDPPILSQPPRPVLIFSFPELCRVMCPLVGSAGNG